MTAIAIGILCLFLLFALLALGMPIGLGMLLVGTGGMWILISDVAAFVKLAIVPFQTVYNYELGVLPLFLLMAHIVFQTGMGKDMFTLAATWFGHQPGGVAQGAVVGCAGFAAVSASSVATAATMGLVALPEMKRLNYDPALATGAIAAGGSIGILIPPSGVLILYGIITGTSIGKLFMAGAIPGILQALFYVITIAILCRLKPSLGPRGPKTTFKEKIFAFRGCGEILGLIIFVIGGLVIGLFTPTEAGAMGAFGAILFSMLRKRLTIAKLQAAFLDTMKTTGMLYLILMGAMVFKYFLAATTLPFVLSEFVTKLQFGPTAIIIVILIVYLVLGCFLDPASMTVLTIPIFFPVAENLGFNPILFGILLTRAMEIAMITPPIGMNVFVISGLVPDVPLQTIYKGIFPFLIADVLHMALLLFVPSVVLFLPGLMGY